MDAEKANQLQIIANTLRIHSVESTTSAGSGHPTSCASIAEIMSVLFFDEMKYRVSNPADPSNDRFLLSKGHAAPILYAVWSVAGLFPASHLSTLRKLDSDLEGHPTPALSFVDVATGSLGQGLGVAAGMAWVAKYLDKQPYRVYCLLGDGECAEGSVWEAMNFASAYKLDNLLAIIDVNRLGQSQATLLQHDMNAYKNRVEAFGCHAIAVDGHCAKDIKAALDAAKSVKDKPTVIIAKTFKGAKLEGIENKDGWHGRPLKSNEVDAALAKLRPFALEGPCPLRAEEPSITVASRVGAHAPVKITPEYTMGQKLATRLAYGTALAKLSKLHDRVISLDGDTKNSTFAIKFKEVAPDRFIECFIAEQNMISVATGASCRNRAIPFVSGFACFLSRGFDQVRMAAISKTNVKFCGSHAGISIGEDGGSQMGLEDLAMFRAIPGSVVFYPSDAVATEKAVELSMNTHGICYIRTGRPEVPVIYKNDEEFCVGKAKVVMESAQDVCTVVAAGVTLFEALKACEILTQCGKPIRIIDPFTVQPIDAETIIKNAKQTRGRIIVVEDHYPAGGLGEAVASAVSHEPSLIVRKLAVMRLPRSGPAADLLHMFGIDSKAITTEVNKLCS